MGDENALKRQRSPRESNESSIAIVDITVIILLCTGSLCSAVCGNVPCPPVTKLRSDGMGIKPSFNTSSSWFFGGLNLTSGTNTSCAVVDT